MDPLQSRGWRRRKERECHPVPYALVESDTLPIAEQNRSSARWNFRLQPSFTPAARACMPSCTSMRRMHDEYRKRVEFLYDFLEKTASAIDKQNRNPSRLSRMPGVTRNGNRQYLVATNIGRKSWNDWMDYAEGVTTSFPAWSRSRNTRIIRRRCRRS
jgi:hypothetical protein